ncbi:MAG: nucleotidyltransferase domain-containing protein [Oxalobacteraceae bacterium]
MPDIDLTPAQWASISVILERHLADRQIWAFGSRATRSAKPYSDLDLAIIGEQPVSIALLAALAHDFTESNLPFKVDLIDWATTGEGFRRIITRDHVVLQ